MLVRRKESIGFFVNASHTEWQARQGVAGQPNTFSSPFQPLHLDKHGVNNSWPLQTESKSAILIANWTIKWPPFELLCLQETEHAKYMLISWRHAREIHPHNKLLQMYNYSQACLHLTDTRTNSVKIHLDLRKYYLLDLSNITYNC